jgi:hypothetical protein
MIGRWLHAANLNLPRGLHPHVIASGVVRKPATSSANSVVEHVLHKYLRRHLGSIDRF